MGRFDTWVRSVGADPDPRFTLANERTFLSWITTSLGFLGVGLAIGTLVPERSTALRVLATAWILVATVLALRGLVRWFKVERAIRLGSPMPLSSSIPFVAAALAMLSVASLAALVAAT